MQASSLDCKSRLRFILIITIFTFILTAGCTSTTRESSERSIKIEYFTGGIVLVMEDELVRIRATGPEMELGLEPEPEWAGKIEIDNLDQDRSTITGLPKDADLNWTGTTLNINVELDSRTDLRIGRNEYADQLNFFVIGDTHSDLYYFRQMERSFADVV